MDWHVFLVFSAFFCVSLLHTTQGFPVEFEPRIREKRRPQDRGVFFQTHGALNLRGLNQVASNVRKRLHDLVDTVTNPLNIQVVSQTDLGNANYDYSQQYDYVDQQYQNPSSFEDSQRGPPYEQRPRGPPHEHHGRGPPHGYDYPPGPPYGHGPPPRGPPHGHGPPPRGPPHGHGPPPRGPPHGHGPPRGGPPYRDPSPPVYEDSNDGNNQNLPETKPGFNQQPNYPGNGNPNVNIELSSTNSPLTSTSINLDELTTKETSNVSEYIEDNFPVILLNENEIR